MPALAAPKGAPTARPKKKKGPDPHWMTSSEEWHINFVKKGMVKHLPQFNIPELAPGEVPPITPSMREKALLQNLKTPINPLRRHLATERMVIGGKAE